MLESCNDQSVQPKFLYEAMLAFKSMIRILKESLFNQQWPFIFRFTFDYVSSKQVKDYIENQLGGGFEFEGSESGISEESEDENGEEDKVYTELTIQMSFDIFSFLSQRASLDQDTAIGSQQDFISSILNSFT